MSANNTNGVIINNIFYTLDELEKDCWLRILNGSLRSKNPFHAMTVGTFSGNEIALRTVILRKVIPQEHRLFFHTDIRSNKWQELQLNHSISVLLYDAAERIQIRINGKAVLHQYDDIANTAWQNTQLYSRRCYMATSAPSDFSAIPTSGLPEAFELKDPTAEESEWGRQNFGVVEVMANTLDWLWLHHAGHRRAMFNYDNNSSSWLVP